MPVAGLADGRIVARPLDAVIEAVIVAVAVAV